MDTPEFSLKDFFLRLYTKGVDEEDIISNAAQVAFYFAFALFPLILFLVSLFGLVLESANDLRAEMFFYLKQVMPYSAFDLVKETIEEVTDASSGGKLTFGVLTALWAASAGIDSIRLVLNGVYNLTETRAYWKTKLISLSMTLSLGVLVTLALSGFFYGSKLLTTALNYLNLPIESPLIVSVVQWVIVAAVLITIFALLYNYLPNHKSFKWVWVSPGAIASIVLWVLVSYAFKFYLGYFDSYSKTYGSLGAMIILMLWLYLTALVILIGGSINAVLQEFSDPETAAAGAHKAAAWEMIAHPDRDADAHAKAAADKKAQMLAALHHDDGTQSEDDEEEENTSDKPVKKRKPPVEKSKLKLAAGLLIGFVSSLRKK